MAEALLGAVVLAGGSVVAAAAAALWRAAQAGGGTLQVEDKEVDHEIQARVELIKPVLRAKVEAAVRDGPIEIDGGATSLWDVP
eukprot:7261926-Pyramimonas_sp.AAC.1